MGSSRSHVEPGRADLSGHDRRASRAGAPARAEARKRRALTATNRSARQIRRSTARAEDRASHQRDLPFAARRSRRGRLADRVRAPDRLSAALRLVRHRIRVPRRRVAHDRRNRRRRSANYGARHVCVTGGEPLAQKRCLASARAALRCGLRGIARNVRRDRRRRSRSRACARSSTSRRRVRAKSRATCGRISRMSARATRSRS